MDYDSVNERKRLFFQTLRFEKTGAVPRDFLANRKVIGMLKELFKINTERELLDILKCDFFYLPSRDLSQNEGYYKIYKNAERLHISESERVCPLGIRWKRGAYDSKFDVDEAISGPLADANSPRDILDHPWPKASDYCFESLIKDAEENGDRIVVGGFWTGIMGDSYRLMGFENFLLKSLLEQELIKTLVDRMTDMYLELNGKLFETLKGKLDVWFFGNDFGSQMGLIMSPEMWLEYFFENIKKLCSLAHSYGIKVMMHSCGSISDLIPYLIEAGVDILDPVQVTAKGMEPEILREKFGGKIIFHGGIDTQDVLINKDSAYIREYCKRTTEIFSEKGGYIFAPSQILNVDIPLENILAMYNVEEM